MLHPIEAHHHHHQYHYQSPEVDIAGSTSPRSSGGDKGGVVMMGRRKPLQILTGIFSRKSQHSSGGENPQSSSSGVGAEKDDNRFYLSDDVEGDSDTTMEDITTMSMWDKSDQSIPEPREALHSPYHARTIDQDMHNLRLSRQDNPFLQVLASRECLNEGAGNDDIGEEETLMSKENLSGASDALSLEEVHARLVRSPPPVMWTRSRNSEPSFGNLTSSKNSSTTDLVFQFPPTVVTTPTPSSHSNTRLHHHHHSPRFLGGFIKKESNTLDVLTAKFNLSPQPRRRPTPPSVVNKAYNYNFPTYNHHHELS